MMRLLKVAAMALGIIGGYLGLSGAPATAAPFNSGAMPLAQVETPLVAKAQWGYGYGRRGYYRPYRAYRPYRVYRPYRAYRPLYYRPRIVCRVRYTAWGPRRVCFRR